MSAFSLPPSGVSKTVAAVKQTLGTDAKKAAWSISTTELLCARMHSWQSALACFEFLRKRRLPIADEAVMSVFLRLRDAADANNGDASASLVVLHSFSAWFDESFGQLVTANGSHSTHTSRDGNDTSHKLPHPLKFLLHGTQHQSTLRPLYHRLRFVLRGADDSIQPELGIDKEHSCDLNTAQPSQALLLGMLSVLSAPCAIVNISLRHNLSRGRWIDALRTIHNLYAYDLVEPYVRELRNARLRGDTTSVLATVRYDTCYKSSVEAPSLVPLMDELLVRWEEYWDTLKGSREAQEVLRGLHYSTPSSIVAVNDDKATEANFTMGNEISETSPDTTNLFFMPSGLESSSLEILNFAALTVIYRECEGDQVVTEEQEVYHRLMEAVTRLADFTVCRRLAAGWAEAYAKSHLSDFEHRVLPSSATEQLLLTRLLLRASSYEVALQVLDEWPNFPSNTSCHLNVASPFCRAVPRALRCPEVVSALATRLPPAVFLQEIVEKRLPQSALLLDGGVWEVVKNALYHFGLYDAAEKKWMFQANLELTALLHDEELDQSNGAFLSLMRSYLLLWSAFCEKVRFISGLLHHMGEMRYTTVIDALLAIEEREEGKEEGSGSCVSAAPHTCGLSLLVEVMCVWITKERRPGDAAVLLRHIIYALDQKSSKSLELHVAESERDIYCSRRSRKTEQALIVSFSEAVARLGFLTKDTASHEDELAETARQWLRLLSEIPSTLFDEPTLVIWLFWAMRAVVQWEELVHSTSASSTAHVEAITASVLVAVRNLCASLGNCEAEAVLPPMLLNWLAARTGMSWSDATAWITKHAGEVASQNQKFVFIRLPLGRAAFDSFMDLQSTKNVLLNMENELDKKIFGQCDSGKCFVRLGEDSLGENLRELFIAIRITLLRAWCSRALDALTSEALFSNADDSVTCTTPPSDIHHKITCANRHCSTRGDAVLCSIQETLQCFWDKKNLLEKQ